MLSVTSAVTAEAAMPVWVFFSNKQTVYANTGTTVLCYFHVNHTEREGIERKVEQERERQRESKRVRVIVLDGSLV